MSERINPDNEPVIEEIELRATAKKVFKNEQQKAREERKEFVPIVNAKRTIEVQAKQIPTTEQIEQVRKIEQVGQVETLQQSKKIKKEKPKKKEKNKKKSKKSKEKIIEWQKPKKTDLSGNSILIITEKPQAAAKISAALSEGRAKLLSAGQGVSYYEFPKNNENIIIACAVGHLFSLSQDIKGSNYPIFEISWKPNFEVKKNDFTRKYYANLSKLVKRAKEIIVATDYDVEGEVIGYNIIRYIAGQKDAKRMKFSSLTARELEEAYQKVHPNIDWGQAIAGETRHYLDWFYGINLSRALMNSIKSTGKFKIMSIGRVQGPALNLIVQKEKQITAFKSKPFWRVFLDIVDKKDKKNKVQVRYIKDLVDKKDLNKFKDLKGKEVNVNTKKTSQSIQPPAPFDLTTLQTEAYKFFSITPSRTLQIAQQLYLAGLISYPRTSSQKIPEAINPKKILKRISEQFPEVNKACREKPIEGSKSDPAHPSIYPTGEFQEIGGDDKKIYELIVKRFIACFCPDALIENKTITAEINNLLFKARGLEIKEKGWMEVYLAKMQEKEIKDINGTAIIEKVEIQEDQTKPPKRYSPASIISELEKRGLGTKATRANIIETLYDRNYVADTRSIKATPLGINIIDTLERYSPIITDEKLTRDIEKDTEQMQVSENKQNLEKKQAEVLEKAKKALIKISESFHKNEKKIGTEIVTATEELWKKQKEENELCECPVCKKGKLAIKYSPKFRRSFIACNAYPECKTTFGLPPNGLIKKTDKFCEFCKLPMMISLRKGKKPWIFCFNPNCESRKSKVQSNSADKESNTQDNSEENSEQKENEE